VLVFYKIKDRESFLTLNGRYEVMELQSQ